MNQPKFPLPSLNRMMVFIDGENLVARYQSMLDAGRKPLAAKNIAYEKDVFSGGLAGLDRKSAFVKC